jgi:membrane protein
MIFQEGGSAVQLYRTLRYYARKFGSYHISTYAASASFFIITAIFPLMMLALSIVSYTPLSTQDFLDMIGMILPDSFEPLLSRVTESMTTTSATALSLSLLGTLWTASKSMLGLLDGLNAIAAVNDTRNFVFKRMICMVYMLVLILGLLFNLALRVFGQYIHAKLLTSAPRLAQLFSSVMELRGLTLFVVVSLVFVLIYTFFPNKKLKFYMQIPGACFTSLAWLLFSTLFSIYVGRVGQFSALYGSLTMLILAMLWLYFCMYIVFIGAVLNKVYPEVFWKAFVFLKNRANLHRAKKTP